MVAREVTPKKVPTMYDWMFSGCDLVISTIIPSETEFRKPKKTFMSILVTTAVQTLKTQNDINPHPPEVKIE